MSGSFFKKTPVKRGSGRITIPVVVVCAISILLILAMTRSSLCDVRVMWAVDGVKVCDCGQVSSINFDATTDGVGGAIVTWQEKRAVSNDIYAQRVTSEGVPAWGEGGITVCNAENNQFPPMIVSDGKGGAVIAWGDVRSGANEIYAQRIDGSGDTLWAANGVQLCGHGKAYGPKMIPDGKGGAIVAWDDFSSGIAFHIYAQKVSSDGIPQWPVDGVPIYDGSDYDSDEQGFDICTDGSGGILCTWDAGSYSHGDTGAYAQRVNAGGNRLWSADGAHIIDGQRYMSSPNITSDDAGGAIITCGGSPDWGEYDFYAQKIDPDGNLLWKKDPVVIDAPPQEVVSDGSGGVILVWQGPAPGSSRSSDEDILAQRLDSSGQTRWSSDGVTVCDAVDEQFSPRALSDGEGGAFVTWTDRRLSELGKDIYAQRIDSNGVREWVADGIELCSADELQSDARIVHDGSGSPVFLWEDKREDSDIYAQKVSEGSRAWYLAEGTCRPGFDSYICIQNPTDDDAEVRLTYMKGDGTTDQQTLSVVANSRSTVSVKDRLGVGDDIAHDFSTKVEAVDGTLLIVERPVYFNYRGKWTGGHNTLGAETPSTELYFAEGTCRPGFDPYICIQNPEDVDADVKITYMKGDGTSEEQTLVVGAHSRHTVVVKDVLGEGDDPAHDFSAKVETTNDTWIVAERPMYFNYRGMWTGGHNVTGATAPSSRFYLAEGTCRPGFDSYICIQNPEDIETEVTITYMKGDGTTEDETVVVGPRSRSTVAVKDTLGEGDDPAHDFSVSVETKRYTGSLKRLILVERPVYFEYRGEWTGGHTEIGAQGPSISSYLAEGTCRPDFDPYICIQNPSDDVAQVEIIYMKGDATTLEQSLSIAPYSRSTVVVKSVLGEGNDEAHDFSAKVESLNETPIIVERPIYFNYQGIWTGGHDVLGIEF